MIEVHRIRCVLVVCVLISSGASAEPQPIRASMTRHATSAGPAHVVPRPDVAHRFLRAEAPGAKAGNAAMHPAAKGALIGAAVGAGSLGVFGWWYCTAGPGECSGENWRRAIPVWSAVGAGVGALIGVLR